MLDGWTIKVSVCDHASEGLRVVAAMARSLANLYLTASAPKTKVLSLTQARKHFHLEVNARLDEIAKMISSRAKTRRGLVRVLAREWRIANRSKDHGEWAKIQKRFYRLAGQIKGKFLRRSASRELLKTPTLTEQIADYMRCSGSVNAYITLSGRPLLTNIRCTRTLNLISLKVCFAWRSGVLEVTTSAN
jgi:hypothetical protein